LGVPTYYFNNSLFRGSKVIKDVKKSRREARIPIPEEEKIKINKQYKRNRILTIILRFIFENDIDYILYCITYTV